MAKGQDRAIKETMRKGNGLMKKERRKEAEHRLMKEIDKGVERRSWLNR